MATEHIDTPQPGSYTEMCEERERVLSEGIRPQTGRIRDTQTMARAMGVRRELQRARQDARTAWLRVDEAATVVERLEAQVAALREALRAVEIAVHSEVEHALEAGE